MSVPVMTFAQLQKTGNLSIFSEDGDKFYLVLNGEKQNNIAQANLRLEELPQPYYSARIIFADSTISPISKNNLMIISADNVMMDVTYKIKKDKSGKAKLNYFSAIEVQQDFIPPAGAHVYHYGRPDVVQVSNGTILTQTTTTTNTSGVSANVQVNGMSMNVAIADPVMQNTTITTTTTTTNNSNRDYSNNNSSHRDRSHENNSRDNANEGCNYGRQMNQSDFAAALKTISNSSFEDTKLSTAESITSKNCLSCEQVLKICALFSFEETKLNFAKKAYKYTTDKKNYFKINETFSFSSSKDELNKYVSEN
jgi:hypothetical protein